MTKAMREQAAAMGVALEEGMDPAEATAAATAAPSIPAGARTRRQAPGPGAPEADEEPDDLVTIQDEVTEATLPHIPGGRVIYLGPSKRKSISVQGIIQIERWETEAAQVRPARYDPTTGAVISPEQEIAPAKYDERRYPDAEGGNYCYDFSTHDTRGRMNAVRLMSQTTKDPRLRNKPWSR